MSRSRNVFRKTGDIFELMVDECDTYAAVVEKASQCLELAERCYLETFSTVTHFTHCNLCTGTLLYIAGQEDSV